MPFQLLPDAGPEKPQPTDFGLVIVRVVTVAIFFYYQLFAQLASARDYVWDSQEWSLIEQIAAKGLPVPDIIATCAIVIFSITLLGVVLGIFTRLNALILTLMNGVVLLAPFTLSVTLNPQTLALYIGIFAALALGGGGRLSLDYSLASHRERRRMPL